MPIWCSHSFSLLLRNICTSTIFQKGAGLLYASVFSGNVPWPLETVTLGFCSSFCPSLSVGFRCNPLSIQTCPSNSSLTDQSPLITKCICFKTTTKVSKYDPLWENRTGMFNIAHYLHRITSSLRGPSPKTLSAVSNELSCPQRSQALDFQMAHYRVSQLTGSLQLTFPSSLG